MSAGSGALFTRRSQAMRASGEWTDTYGFPAGSVPEASWQSCPSSLVAGTSR